MTGAFVAGAFFTVLAGERLDRLACARVRDRAATVGFFFGVGLFAGVVETPEATRDECFTRCRTARFGGAAASAIDDSVNAATSATNSIFIVLRTIRASSRSE